MRERVTEYRFFSKAFEYPGSELPVKLKKILATAGTDLKPLRDIVDILDRTPLTALQSEYTRLFMSSFPEVPCPPYESAYREGLLMGSPAERVALVYSRTGLKASREMPDHVSTELEFMAYALAFQPNEVFINFFTEHILPWVPRFVEDVADHASIEFYRELARALKRFIETESG
jgi:TorA maturation chaperone TorD